MSAELDDLLPVSLNTVLADCNLDCDFFLLDKQGGPQLYRRRGVPFTASDIQNLLSRGTKCLYINGSDSESYREHVLSRFVNNNSMPFQERLEIVREASKAVVEETWQRGSLHATVSVMRDMADQMTRLITNEDLLFQDLIDLMVVDYSAYAHATNVCSFALLIAKSSGISDRERLIQIAKGALLHDAGKYFGQPILRRRPSPEELEETKKREADHPTIGFKIFSQNDTISWAALMAIYQHHERIDGKGFPVGAIGEDIHEAARICAVANFYEKQWRAQQKLNRVDPKKLRTALEAQAGTMLDAEMVASMLAIVDSQQPVEA